MPRSKILNCTNNAANVGINSTPLIDQASNTLYVISLVLDGGNPVYYLHALDLGSLADKVPSVVVSASHTLTNGSTYSLSASFSRQRSGLVGANGNIYAGFASWCDWRPDMSRGWLLGWEAGSLKPLAANRLNNQIQPDPVGPYPNIPGPPFFLSSIWMSGYGVGADASGNLFVVSGNSHSSPQATNYSPTNNLQESVIKLSPDLSSVLSYFTPSGSSSGVVPLDEADNDFGSGGVMLLPYQPGPRPRLATAAGKVGQMFLLDRDQLAVTIPAGQTMYSGPSILADAGVGNPTSSDRTTSAVSSAAVATMRLSGSCKLPRR